jgi:trimeric autotransporter adhesin
MQALLDVFDTNHDGALDAGDANFANFFVMVTNADGTQTAQSLASLGITAINLNQDATNIALPDGSSINGETTFTTSSGSGTAATVTFAADPFGHVVRRAFLELASLDAEIEDAC